MQRLLIFAIICLAALPIISLIVIATTNNNNSDAWQHLIAFVLPQTIFTTIILLLCTAIFTTIIGTSLAWLITIYDFPLKKFFNIALLAPIAIPPYIAAYALVEIFDGIFLLNIESLAGAIFVFSLTLYPYVYLIVRINLTMQRSDILEAARTLGANTQRLFWQIAMPLARPAIAVGIALVMMETLNDIGAVEYLGVRTITFAIFETWLNRGDLTSAVQLALGTLLIIFIVISLEKTMRRKNKISAKQTKTITPMQLPMHKKILATSFCTTIISLSFVLPILLLVSYVIKRPEQIFSWQIISASFNSFTIGILTAITTIAIAFFILALARINNKPNIARLGKLTSLGYAMPGTILAIGLLYPLALLDNFLAEFVNLGLLFSGTIFIIVYGCSVRFLAIAWGHIESGFSQISQTVDESARALGKTPAKIIWQIHLPILQKAIIAASLFVFVDTCKELSATMLLRPIGFETLATLVYDKASQAIIEEGAIAACYIILLGLIPIIWLAKNKKYKFLNF